MTVRGEIKCRKVGAINVRSQWGIRSSTEVGEGGDDLKIFHTYHIITAHIIQGQHW